MAAGFSRSGAQRMSCGRPPGRGRLPDVDSSDPSAVPDPTLAYYEAEAARITDGYEGVDLTKTLSRVAAHLPPGARVLELGAGSGRDAAWFLDRGFDVTALDGSQAMADRAAKLHPELAGRLLVHRLPTPLPFEAARFDAVVSFATIMHLGPGEIPAVLTDCRRVLRPHGVFAASVPTARADLDADGYDPRGRRFTVFDAAGWNERLDAVGLRIREAWSAADAAGRAGIRWYTVVAEAHPAAK